MKFRNGLIHVYFVLNCWFPFFSSSAETSFKMDITESNVSRAVGMICSAGSTKPYCPSSRSSHSNVYGTFSLLLAQSMLPPVASSAKSKLIYNV